MLKKNTSLINDSGFSTKDYASNVSSNKDKTSSTDDYYELAKQQEYDVLMDKEVALENAKSNALKYTQNQINAQGFGGTGYGSSMQSGIYNTYLNKVGDATSEYNTNIQSINQQQKEANETASALRTGNITSMLQSSTSQEQMDSVLADYGISSDAKGNIGVRTENSDGTITYEKPANLSEDEWIQLKYFYNAQKSALSQDNYNGVYANSESDFRNLTVPVENGRQTTINETWDKETSVLFSHINVGDVKVGDVVKMTNSDGMPLYVQYTTNGIVVVNRNTYDNATSKHEIVRNKTDDYSWR